MTVHTEPHIGYYSPEACNPATFETLVTRMLDPRSVPNAADIAHNIPIYDAAALQDRLQQAEARRMLMSEWAGVLKDASGVIVIRQAQPNMSAIDEATAVFLQIIAREKEAGANGADHFAAAGTNDRVWNALQKLCETAPDVFARYFASPAVDAAAESWLGPNYQMTAQVNLVHPGGAAQDAHRDYHLGFQTAEVCATYPAHVHDLSPLMTLQGGIAHCDMTMDSGPTKLLPFSQLYRPGYAAWRRDDFRAIFEKYCVQLPMNKGDALFFNPALFHAAGENKTTDVQRMVNLLQISSAFGRAMESVDRLSMCKALFKPLRQMWSDGAVSRVELHAIIAASAEGYAFPTNLDTDPPVGGLSPKSQAVLLTEAVLNGASGDDVATHLEAQAARKTA